MRWPGTQMETVSLSSKVCRADLFIQADTARGVSWWTPVAAISDLLIQVVVGASDETRAGSESGALIGPTRARLSWICLLSCTRCLIYKEDKVKVMEDCPLVFSFSPSSLPNKLCKACWRLIPNKEQSTCTSILASWRAGLRPSWGNI